MPTVDITSAGISNVINYSAAAPYDITVSAEAIVVMAQNGTNFNVTAKLFKVGETNAHTEIEPEITLVAHATVADKYIGDFVTSGDLQPGDVVFVQVKADIDYHVSDREATLTRAI